MVERADLVSELVRDVYHLRHLVRAVAVVVNEDISAQHFGERLAAKVARRRISFVIGVPLVPLAAVVLRLDPRRTISGDISHPRLRSAALSVDPLRVLTARHLESVLCARELHGLHGPARNDLQDDASSADEICRAWEHLQRGDAAGQIARKLWILRPNRMLGPDLRSRRAGRFVAIAQRVSAGRRVHSEVRVIVDQAGSDVLAGAVDDQRIGGRVNARPNRRDFSILQQYRAVSDQRSRCRQDVDVANDRGARREGNVGAGKWIRVRSRRAATADVGLR